MAELVTRAGELVVRLSPVEKAGGFHGDIRVPFPAVRRVSVVHDPWSTVRGLRAPGTGIRGLIMLGTCRGRFGKDFAAVYGKSPAVLLELRDHEFRRLLLCTRDPEGDASSIRNTVTTAA